MEEIIPLLMLRIAAGLYLILLASIVLFGAKNVDDALTKYLWKTIRIIKKAR